MKKIALGVVFAFAGSAYAYDLGVPLNFAGPYDVVAPALYGDPSGADRVVDQVY